MVNSEVKVSTVEVESVDNMATLPVSRTHGGSEINNEKNTAIKEMELKYVQPKPDKRYLLVYKYYMIWSSLPSCENKNRSLFPLIFLVISLFFDTWFNNTENK